MGQLEDDEQKRQQGISEWVDAKNAQVQNIEKTGSFSPWVTLANLKNNILGNYHLAQVDTNMSQHGTMDDDQIREKAYEQAKDRAYKIYEARQGQSVMPTPTPVSRWEMMLKKGKQPRS